MKSVVTIAVNKQDVNLFPFVGTYLMRNEQVKYTAICGIFAGLAISIMYFGGLIPIATYVTPMLCIIIMQIILHGCGKRFAWTWYIAVSILSLLLSPDKEAALLFLFLGGYPCLKQIFERSRLHMILKLLYFNASISVLYYLVCTILGLSEIQKEYSEFNRIGLIVFLVLGNITFLLLDRILSFKFRKKRK